MKVEVNEHTSGSGTVTIFYKKQQNYPDVKIQLQYQNIDGICHFKIPKDTLVDLTTHCLPED